MVALLNVEKKKIHESMVQKKREQVKCGKIIIMGKSRQRMNEVFCHLSVYLKLFKIESWRKKESAS